MQSSVRRVFSWKTFANFVVKQTRYKKKKRSHPVLDAVATALLTGALIRRKKKGRPVKPWLKPSKLPKSYLDPDEVNQLAMMKKWRLVWTPVAKTPQVPTVLQQVQSYGWKATLQMEANRLWKEQKNLGVKPVLATIASLLHKFAQEHQINRDRGGLPSANYIRVHVLSRKAWPRPD